MISDKIIKHIIDDADATDLRNFARVVMDSLTNGTSYPDEDIINNALEIISGEAKLISAVDISEEKVLDYIHQYGYRGAEATIYKIISIDNFKREINVEYNTSKESDKLECTTNIYFRHVLKSVKV